MSVNFSVSVPDAVPNLFYGRSANVSWERALGGLSGEQARAVPPGSGDTW